jgi:hypothetical protein
MTKPVVLNMLANRQFRDMRVIKPQPIFLPTAISVKLGFDMQIDRWFLADQTGQVHYMPKPRYQVGDRLLVAEGYQINRQSGVCTRTLRGKYLADESKFSCDINGHEWDLWRARKYPHRPTSGRFMYKSLARIIVPEVTAVTVQKPQDLTAKEWAEEGIYDPRIGWADQPDVYIMLGKNLWNSLHKDGWQKNEWCFVTHWQKVEVE